jgi:Protein kinase domain
VANVLTRSTTRSTYRLHWNRLAHWDDFGARVIEYWNNTVTQNDKQAAVLHHGAYSHATQLVTLYSRAASEDQVKGYLRDFFVPVHSAAANGLNYAPPPSDRHSILQRWEQGVEANALAGIPDFVMATEDAYPLRRVTALLEVKNPWQVTPELIDQVIQSISHHQVHSHPLDQVPLSGRYPARLALEQLYGYMVRNAKVYGVLTTMKVWCFLRRDNGGVLHGTRMFGDFQARQGISEGATREGYYPTTGFSIMQALYYLSALAQATPNVPETPIGGLAGQVTLPYAGNTTKAAPTLQQPQPGAVGVGPIHGGQGGYQYGAQILGGYDQAECSQYDGDFEYRDFQFEPWVSENNLGPKTWIATSLPNQTKVILKLWDAWKFDSDNRDGEASVYLCLRPLWRKCIPALLVKSALEFCHALVFEYIKVHVRGTISHADIQSSPLSASNLNSKVEDNILQAFEAIHALNVIHGDVRPENVLVAEEDSRVWTVDFGFAEILEGLDVDVQSELGTEMVAVRDMLREVTNSRSGLVVILLISGNAD